MEVLEHRTSINGENSPPLPPTAPGLTAVEADGSPQDLTGPPGSDSTTPGECQGVREEAKTGEEEEADAALDVFHPPGEAGEQPEWGPASLVQADSLDVFQPPGEAEEQPEWGPASLVQADSLRCQVKITTRRNLHLRISNHTSRDVYVRVVGRQGRVSGSGVVALKEAVHLSQLQAPPTEAELCDPGPVNAPAGDDVSPVVAAAARVFTETSNGRPQTTKPELDEEDEESSNEALTISELVYSPCASMLPTPVEDNQGGVDLLFSSPVQSPAWLLRELHADPDIQAQLEAERERDRAYERVRQAGRSRVGGVLSSGLRLLSSNERANACLLSVARFVAVVTGVLLVVVPTLLLLLESDIDVSFLHEIRQTPEFQQFHYEYYCPLRRWVLCKIGKALEKLWSD
ncbi:unnamed protein product [Boreogadus saida]